MADDLHTLTARVEQILAAALLLGEGQRDTIEALNSLRAALIVLDTKGDLRAEQAEKIAEVVAKIERAVANIEKPVVAHYDGLRLAQEANAANVGKWANFLTVERAVAAVKWIAGILALLGLGGGVGANFRGCGAVLTTAADAPVTVAPVESSP